MSKNKQRGRPKKQQLELEFKANYQQNEERIELECQTLMAIYTHFGCGTSQQVQESNFRTMVNCLGCQHIYQIMSEANLEKQQLSPADNCRFTSKRDIRFFLHLLSRTLTKPLTSCEILLFAACYIEKLKMLSSGLLDCFREGLNSGTFEKILFEGPQPCTKPQIGILNRIAHWMLALLVLQNIQLRRQPSANQEDDRSEVDKSLQESADFFPSDL